MGIFLQSFSKVIKKLNSSQILKNLVCRLLSKKYENITKGENKNN